MYLVYENNGTRMQVTFEPRIPYNKSNPMAATLISYEIPWTKDNENAMKEAALAKYGQVSARASTWLNMLDPAWQNARIKFMDQQNATKPQI